MKYSSETVYGAIGRNGYTHVTGIEVTTCLEEVHLEPINSRGQVTVCRIPIPRADVPALIEELQKACG